MLPRVAWIAILLGATVAHADPAEERALAHLDRGVAAYHARDYARAHVELAEAQRLAPDRPNPYRWLALTEVELGDCRSALANVEAFLSHAQADDPRIPELIGIRARCAATGSLRVESSPSGAALRIDGEATIAVTPTPDLSLSVGRHHLALAKSGYRTHEASVEIRAMGLTHASYALTGAAPPLYKRWWLWTAVGALAVGAGVTYALTRGGDAQLPPVTCGAGGCRP